MAQELDRRPGEPEGFWGTFVVFAGAGTTLLGIVAVVAALYGRGEEVQFLFGCIGSVAGPTWMILGLILKAVERRR